MFWPCKFQESINPRKSKFAPFFFLFKIIPAVFVMVTVFICVIVPSLFIFPQPAFANEVSKFHHRVLPQNLWVIKGPIRV